MHLRRDPQRWVLEDRARCGSPCCVALAFGEDRQRPTSPEGRGALLGPGAGEGLRLPSLWALDEGGALSLRDTVSSRLEVSGHPDPEEDALGVSSRPDSSPASWLGLRQAPLGGCTPLGHPPGFGVLVGRSTEPAGGREGPGCCWRRGSGAGIGPLWK